MDLDPIGKHCTLQSCNTLDFLPIQCSCLRWFCNLHISPDLHDCPSVQQHLIESSSTSTSLTPARPKCAFSGCNKPSLSGVAPVEHPRKEEPTKEVSSGCCAGCQRSFCVDHRHMQSHSCASLGAGEGNVKTHEAARALLAEKFLAPGAQTSHTPVVARQRANKSLPTDPRKLAQLQKVNLMKLRHKAIPGDTKDRDSVVSVDQRLHVIVQLEIVGQSAKEVVMWFRKTIITGKALDLVARHFGVSHAASTLYLKRSSAEDASQVLQNHLEISEQLEDGSTIVLTDAR